MLAPTDEVLRFYEEVLSDVLEIFPSPFIHIGGDECPKDQWRTSPAAQERIAREGLGDEDGLQAWFVRHFDRWLAARGRRLIGCGGTPGRRLGERSWRAAPWRAVIPGEVSPPARPSPPGAAGRAASQRPKRDTMW